MIYRTKKLACPPNLLILYILSETWHISINLLILYILSETFNSCQRRRFRRCAAH